MPTCRSSASLFAAAVVLASLHAPVVLAKPAEIVDAGPEVARARAAYLRAERHFREGRYRAAMKEYATGFGLTSLPGFLLNIADCHLHLGNHAEARNTYLRFLGMAGADDPHRAAVEHALAEAEAGRWAMRTKQASPLTATLRAGPGLRAASGHGPRTAVRADKLVPTRDEAGESNEPPVVRAAPPNQLTAPTWAPPPQCALSPEAAEVTAAMPGRSPATGGTWVWPSVAAGVVAAVVVGFFVLRSEENVVQGGTIGTLSR